MKTLPLIACALVSVLNAACAGQSKTSSAVAANDGANATAPVAPASSEYSCTIHFDNAKVQPGPLWVENFAFAASDTSVYKKVGVTSPAAAISGTISRETNTAGKRIDLMINDEDTHGMAVAQFAEGESSLQVLYSTNGDDLVTLACSAN